MTNPIRYGNKFFRGHPTGSKSFTQTETWVVPTGVRYINVALVGAGGSGGNGYWCYVGDSAGGASGGGGAGGYILRQSNIRVHRGDIVSVVVGGAATTLTVNGTTYTGSKGGNGGSYYWSGAWPYPGSGGSGGSGGGGGNRRTKGHSSKYAGQTAGGSNGSNGASGSDDMWSMSNAGSGNGQDCRINGVLFSSGGRGGEAHSTNGCSSYRAPGGPNTGNGGDAGHGGYGNTHGGGVGGGTGFALVTW